MLMRRLAALSTAVIALAACGGAPPHPQARSGPSVNSSPPAELPLFSQTATSTGPVTTLAGSPSSRYVFPVPRCRTSYGRSHHDYPATDVFAARGCAYVAVTNGRIDEVSATDRWDPKINAGATRGGLAVSLVGDDGVRYYGSHFSRLAVGVRPGLRVHAGDLLGYVGNSGDARAVSPHVHFGISWPTRPGVWWVRRGEVYPWPYLDAWRGHQDVSPARAVAAKRALLGVVPPCRVTCS
jgi:murein DD-endopeptidase MepM/ murein hydrolase activator NlpD